MQRKHEKSLDYHSGIPEYTNRGRFVSLGKPEDAKRGWFARSGIPEYINRGQFVSLGNPEDTKRGWFAHLGIPEYFF